MKPIPTPAEPGQPETRAQAAVRLASRPDGISSIELQQIFGVRNNVTSSLLHRLKGYGWLFAGGDKPFRYFADEAAARRFRRAEPTPSGQSWRGDGKAAKRKAAPVVLAATAQVIVPANVKRTVAPTPVDSRFTVAPGEHVWGAGFAALRMGQYLAPAHCGAAKAVG